jgi:cytochrome oxidase Cu insertion factor (SCO1/SenC/PrrC family)
MKKINLTSIFSVICLLLAMTLSSGAHAASSEDEKLARYGQYGGPFTLINHHGKNITNRDLLGQYVMMFFGYTFCPDVCPTTMQAVSDTLDILGTKGEKIQPVFVSIDPARDTPEALAGFVSHFHPRMMGLTGTKEQLLALANDYGASYFKVFLPPTIGDSDDEEEEKPGYLYNHSAATYLMGPDGKFITYFPFGMPPEQMAEETLKVLQATPQ